MTEIGEACQAYRDYLRENGFWDWEELRLFKGLEMEAVFIPHIHKTFTKEEADAEATERRLHYMAMEPAPPRFLAGLKMGDIVPGAKRTCSTEGLICARTI